MKGSLDLGVFSTKIPRKLKIFVNCEYLFTMSRDFYQMAQKNLLYIIRKVIYLFNLN